MKIIIGADHRGFSLKEDLKKFLLSLNFEVLDQSSEEVNEKDDYTLVAEKVALLVSKNTSYRGILLCGSGVGVDVTANKFDGIRASIGLAPEQIVAGRTDDNMNVLVIAADFTDKKMAEDLSIAFLKTDFDDAVRHSRRLSEIERIEENN